MKFYEDESPNIQVGGAISKSESGHYPWLIINILGEDNICYKLEVHHFQYFNPKKFNELTYYEGEITDNLKVSILHVAKYSVKGTYKTYAQACICVDGIRHRVTNNRLLQS